MLGTAALDCPPLPTRPIAPYVWYRQRGAPSHRAMRRVRGDWSEGTAMDRRDIFGGNPFGVLLRLALISLVVGVVLSALGITPYNFIYNIEVVLRRIYDLGLASFDWVLQYLLLGAMVVVPVWLIARLFGLFRSRGPEA